MECKKYFYRVRFMTKRNGIINWVIDLPADNQNEAKEIARQMWVDSEHTAHMFLVCARKLRDDEEFLYHWFKIV